MENHTIAQVRMLLHIMNEINLADYGLIDRNLFNEENLTQVGKNIKEAKERRERGEGFWTKKNT